MWIRRQNSRTPVLEIRTRGCSPDSHTRCGRISDNSGQSVKVYTDHRLPTDFVPMGAVVTASGTGAEQNNGAVITHEEKKLKQPLFGAYHSFSVLDSDLTKTLPMAQVISGAFYMTEQCFSRATGTADKELFLIPGATHIKTYYVPEYVDAAVKKLTEFFGSKM